MSASERIKAAIAYTGMSQKAFAQATGIPLRTLEHWIAGDRIPPEYVVSLIEFAVKNANAQTDLKRP